MQIAPLEHMPLSLPVELGEGPPEVVRILKAIKDAEPRREKYRADNGGGCRSGQLELRAAPERKFGSASQDLIGHVGLPDGTAKYA